MKGAQKSDPRWTRPLRLRCPSCLFALSYPFLNLSKREIDFPCDDVPALLLVEDDVDGVGEGREGGVPLEDGERAPSAVVVVVGGGVGGGAVRVSALLLLLRGALGGGLSKAGYLCVTYSLVTRLGLLKFGIPLGPLF